MEKFKIQVKRNIFPVLLLLLLPLADIIYGKLNGDFGTVHSLVTDLDRAIPFMKIFVIPYLSWYPFLFTALLLICFHDRNAYYKTFFSIIIGLSVSFFIFHIFQTTVPRPVVTGDDILSRLVDFVYKTDEPFNCFPSIHVLTSYILFKGVLNMNNLAYVRKLPFLITSVLIIMSTQFIKQHVLLDLIFAILLGEVIYKVVDNFNMEMNLVWIKKQFS